MSDWLVAAAETVLVTEAAAVASDVISMRHAASMVTDVPYAPSP